MFNKHFTSYLFVYRMPPPLTREALMILYMIVFCVISLCAIAKDEFN